MQEIRELKDSTLEKRFVELLRSVIDDDRYKQINTENTIEAIAWASVIVSMNFPLAMAFTALIDYFTPKFGKALSIIMTVLISTLVLNEFKKLFTLQKDYVANSFKHTYLMYKLLMANKILSNADKLAALGFPEVLIPNKYRCQIGHGIFTRPVRIGDSLAVCEEQNLYKYLFSNSDLINNIRCSPNISFDFHNLFTKETMHYPSDVHVVDDLQEEAKEFVDIVSVKVRIAKQAQGLGFFAKELSYDQYLDIRDAAIAMVQRSKISLIPD